MSVTMLRVTDDNIYVGERVYVEIQLFNPRTKAPASALAPVLRMIHETGASIEAGNMTESAPGTGIYSGDAVVTLAGNWRVEVTLATPFESKWRYDKLFVQA